MGVESAVTALRDADADATVALRAPTHNHEAEQGLLGAILINNRAYERVSDFLRPAHFSDAIHGDIYAAAGMLIERGQVADAITLKHYFDQDGSLDEVGGVAYLADLARGAVTVINAAEYGRLIHDLYLRRALIDLGQEVVNQAFKPRIDVSATQQIEEAEQGLFELATNGEREGGFRAFSESLAGAIQLAEAAHKRDGHLGGVSSGLDDLDKLLGGLHASDLIILAGRPGMGKTALATNIAFNTARQYAGTKGEDGAVVGLFSLEMSAEQLATRILSEQSGISSEKIRRGDIGNDEFNRVVRASHELEALPIFIDDTPALSVSALRTRARRLQRTEKLGLVVVDYLQLLRPAGIDGARPENRVQEISDITRNLKALAKELNVPVLALSQLSRAVEQREDKRPQLSDLRESGTIEQDSDVVAFVFREEYYLERAEPKIRAEESQEKFNDRYQGWQEHFNRVSGTAEVLVAKQRHGPTGKITLHFDSSTTKFSNHMATGHHPDVRG
ncbi:MAG: replicative DNA helicase [Alphaproteobacteria bacterium]